MIPQRRKKFVHSLFMPYLAYRLRKAFNVVKHNEIEVLPGHSILLLCNHFSWWDGFWAGHLAHTYLHRDLYIMMQEDHLKKRMFFNLLGGFSINRKSKEVVKSLQYAAQLLDHPQNLVTVFPQGGLISNHATEIKIEKGIERLMRNIKGPCQIVYSCVLIDYFESLKPSAYIHLFDCGVAGEVPFDQLVRNINTFHNQALKEQINVPH
jgi:1-acyl-sn-glycerol-3-phosphate acyltransferase